MLQQINFISPIENKILLIFKNLPENTLLIPYFFVSNSEIIIVEIKLNISTKKLYGSINIFENISVNLLYKNKLSKILQGFPSGQRGQAQDLLA